MQKILISILVAWTVFISNIPAQAKSINEFEKNMNIWNEKVALASQYLDEAEEALKNGDELQGCSKQKKAGEYGIKATQALIEAFKINGQSESELSNLQSGLNKWKELRDFC